MKLFNAATALGLSLFGAASADTTKVSRDSFAHRALVEQVGGGPPEGDGKCTKEDLSPEELAAAQAFQTWFVETYFDGDYRAIKDPDGDKLTKLLDVFDTYDLEKDGFLNTAEVAALAADLGLEASFLDAYINCLSQDNLIDEDELLKAVCVGGRSAPQPVSFMSMLHLNISNLFLLLNKLTCINRTSLYHVARR
jgi:hypothetical protein